MALRATSPSPGSVLALLPRPRFVLALSRTPLGTLEHGGAKGRAWGIFYGTGTPVKLKYIARSLHRLPSRKPAAQLCGRGSPTEVDARGVWLTPSV
eukprot:scaffold731_cov261-Pinguiococcus_pyrenoidosus.AAC.27